MKKRILLSVITTLLLSQQAVSEDEMSMGEAIQAMSDAMVAEQNPGMTEEQINQQWIEKTLAFSKALKKGTPYEDRFINPYTGETCSRVIEGTKEGICRVTEDISVWSKMKMVCSFNESDLPAIAEYYKEMVQPSEKRPTYKIGGKEVTDARQSCLDNGDCRYVTGDEEMRAHSKSNLSPYMSYIHNKWVQFEYLNQESGNAVKVSSIGDKCEALIVTDAENETFSCGGKSVEFSIDRESSTPGNIVVITYQ